MLSFIVSEAARGVNIAGHYPAFYRRLLEDPALRERFQDSFDLLLQTQTNTLELLPGPFHRDLSFLKTRPRPEFTFAVTEPSGWCATLKLGRTQLNTLFAPLPAEPATRHGLEIRLDEDNWFTLLRETFATADGSWRVILEGTLVAEPEEALNLVVTVVPTAELEEERFCWRATLIWGDYEGVVAVEGMGRASFPRIRLESVLDERWIGIREGLMLTLVCTPVENSC